MQDFGQCVIELIAAYFTEVARSYELGVYAESTKRAENGNVNDEHTARSNVKSKILFLAFIYVIVIKSSIFILHQILNYLNREIIAI